jgi:hypothetical protein
LEIGLAAKKDLPGGISIRYLGWAMRSPGFPTMLRAVWTPDPDMVRVKHG